MQEDHNKDSNDHSEDTGAVLHICKPALRFDWLLLWILFDFYISFYIS